MLDVLIQLAVFQTVPEAGLARLAERSIRRTFPAEAQLIKQGEPARCMYIILRGKVRVEREHPLLTEPVVIAEIPAGEPVGEMGVLDPGPRSATVIASEETEVLEISAEALQELVLENPDVSRALLRVLSRRLRSTDELAAALQARPRTTRRRRRS